MHHAPIKLTFVENNVSKDPDFSAAWTRLQNSIGSGMVSAEVAGPDTRNGWPLITMFKVEAPGVDAEEAERALERLAEIWHFAFEEIINRHWNLYDSPYATIWVMPGMMLLHQDPLGWVVDEQSESIATGEPLDEPKWMIMMPRPISNHQILNSAKPVTLPHADILSKALTKAATEEGHTQICPLAWKVEMPDPANLNVVGA